MDRIGVDLERLGKAQRQQRPDAWISRHREEDLPAIAGVLSAAQLFARTQPVNPDLPDQIERLLAFGVKVLMLPMFTTPEEVESFVAWVGGRAEVVLLMEHDTAVRRVDEILGVRGIDEIHIGLNDLSISLGLSDRFSILPSGYMTELCERLLDARVPFGINGIGRVDDRRHAIPSDLVYAQYARLGSTAAVLARVFLNSETALDLPTEVSRTRARIADWRTRDAAALERARLELVRITAV